MTTLIVLSSIVAYFATASFVYLRLLWHFKQAKTYEPGVRAFLASFLLPIGVCLLVFYSVVGQDIITVGLAPRSIRRAEKQRKANEEQAAHIRRLERELKITND